MDLEFVFKKMYIIGVQKKVFEWLVADYYYKWRYRLWALHSYFYLIIKVLKWSVYYYHKIIVVVTWCSVYHYCITSFNKVWTEIVRRLKPYLRRVGDLRWWESLTIIVNSSRQAWECYKISGVRFSILTNKLIYENFTCV